MTWDVEAVRAFNRFYTRRVGALDANVLGTGYTLPEARLIFDIAQTDGALASELQQSLGMDAGYLSRILGRFERQDLITRTRSEADGRLRLIRLTPAGRATFEALDKRQREAVERMIASLTASMRRDLASALGLVRTLLSPKGEITTRIRTFRPGDLGLVAARQSQLYAQDYGWGVGLEANVAETTAAFLRTFKPGREQCWIAEAEGTMAGSVMLTDEGGGLCRLRLLYVEPAARGLGLGDALVGTCVAFAREAGYSAMTLWTHAVLTNARRIYAAYGFKRVSQEVQTLFGPPVHSETWLMDLAPSSQTGPSDAAPPPKT